MSPPLAKPPSSQDAPRSWTSLLPRRNFRRALFLVLILLAVLAMKRSGGLQLGTMFDAVAPPPPPTYQLHVAPQTQPKPAP